MRKLFKLAKWTTLGFVTLQLFWKVTSRNADHQRKIREGFLGSKYID